VKQIRLFHGALEKDGVDVEGEVNGWIQDHSPLRGLLISMSASSPTDEGYLPSVVVMVQFDEPEDI
jgi:hypothetical protein